MNVVKSLDLIKKEAKNFYITTRGEELLKNPIPATALNIMLEKIIAFDEILEIISEKQPVDKKTINEELEKRLKLGWKTDAQAGWRLNWLLSLGIVEITTGKYYLTEKGIENRSGLASREIEKEKVSSKTKEEKLFEFSHGEIEDQLKYIGEFFEFRAFKRPRINEMLPKERQLKSSNKELDGLWIKKIPMGGNIYYPIEIQIGGNLSDTIDRLETVSDFAQKAILVIDEEQERVLRERLNAKRSKWVDKIVCLRPEDVNKIMSATNALKSFFQDLFS